MTPTSRTDEELMAQAQEYYAEHLKDQLEPARTGEFVAIDVDASCFEVASDPILAFDRLVEQGCSPPFALLRVGDAWTFRGLPF